MVVLGYDHILIEIVTVNVGELKLNLKWQRLEGRLLMAT